VTDRNAARTPPFNPSTSRASLGSYAVWAVMGQGAGQILSLLFFLVIARFVSQASFGLVAVSLAIVEMIRRLLFDPVTYAINAQGEVTNSDYDLCFNVLLITGGLGAAMLMVFASGVTAVIGSPAAAPVLRVTALILLAMSLAGTHGAWLVRAMRFRALAIRSTLSVVCGGVVGLGMAFAGYDLWSLVGQQLTINLFNIVTLWMSAKYRPRPAVTLPALRDLWQRVRHISLGAAWNSIASDADLFIVSAWFGPAVAGVYNAAKRIMLSANLMLGNAISSVALPALAGIADPQARSRAFLSGLTMASVVTAPAFAGLAATSPVLVHLLLGPRWHAAAPILSALAASGYLLSIAQFASLTLIVMQRTRLDSLTSAFAAAANIIAMLIAAQYGPIALASAFSIATLLALPIRLRFALNALGLGWRDTLTAVLPPAVAAGLMMTVLLAVGPLMSERLPAIMTLAALIALGGLVYIALLRLLAPSTFRSTYDITAEMVGRRKVLA
jgi:O-antigen/teichoic acid export membrane protein